MANWGNGRSPRTCAKPFKIPDELEAFNEEGAQGRDGQSIAEFEANLGGLQLWNWSVPGVTFLCRRRG